MQMSPQAVWSGNISFGLVSIPVRLIPATERKDVRFHLYDRRTGKRVRYERVTRAEESAVFVPDPTGSGSRETPGDVAVNGRGVERESSRDDGPVERDDIVRGAELPEGDLVTLSEGELDAIAPERSRTIELEEFVDLADIDPVFYEKTYYVAPARGGAEKPYVLLQRAMQEAGMAGIGRFVLRTRPKLVAIRAVDTSLVLQTLFFADEVRSAGAFGGALLPDAVSARELKMARQLIDSMAAKWSSDAHGDEYREQLLSLLRSKTPADRAEIADAAPGGSDVDDLMAALRSSVEAVKQRDRTKPSRSRRVG
jgi:DNA end-binding protein Ku